MDKLLDGVSDPQQGVSDPQQDETNAQIEELLEACCQVMRPLARDLLSHADGFIAEEQLPVFIDILTYSLRKELLAALEHGTCQPDDEVGDRQQPL